MRLFGCNACVNIHSLIRSNLSDIKLATIIIVKLITLRNSIHNYQRADICKERQLTVFHITT